MGIGTQAQLITRI